MVRILTIPPIKGPTKEAAHGLVGKEGGRAPCGCHGIACSCGMGGTERGHRGLMGRKGGGRGVPQEPPFLPPSYDPKRGVAGNPSLTSGCVLLFLVPIKLGMRWTGTACKLGVDFFPGHWEKYKTLKLESLVGLI